MYYTGTQMYILEFNPYNGRNRDLYFEVISIDTVLVNYFFYLSVCLLVPFYKSKYLYTRIARLCGLCDVTILQRNGTVTESRYRKQMVMNIL